jgi:hypothetical protein
MTRGYPFAIVRYFRVIAPEHGHPRKTLIAPLLVDEEA